MIAERPWWAERVGERFFSKVALVPNGCWEWQAGLFPNGYGQFCWKGVGQGAHRMLWEFIYGPIPEGYWILHFCDNKKCVHPDHLFMGTAKDNAQDRSEKGRSAPRHGELNTGAKLKEAEVNTIKRALANGVTGVSLAREYGVCTAVVSYIKTGKLWAHINQEKE